MPVKKGDKIKVDYTGTLENGEVFDSSEKHGQPLEFEAGAGQMIKGFDAAVVGMEVGEEKEITLVPADAYGERNDDLQRTVPREQLPKDQDPQEGMMLVIGLPDGNQIPAKISKVDEKEVTLDLNHPLAGQTLKFKLKLVAIN